MLKGLMFVLGIALAMEGGVQAALIEFEDRGEWEAAVSDFTTIGFTGFEDGTTITEQYAGLGAVFTNGTDGIENSSTTFPNDGSGLQDNGHSGITVSFSSPLSWIAVDFPGAVRLELFFADEIVGTTSTFGPSGTGNFGGLILMQPFDSVRVFDPTDSFVLIDDLHFGPPIPSPGTLALLGGVALFGRRRIRR